MFHRITLFLSLCLFLAACGDDGAHPGPPDTAADLVAADIFHPDIPGPRDLAPDQADAPGDALNDAHDTAGDTGTDGGPVPGDAHDDADLAPPVDASADLTEPPVPWRSALYPEDWSPAHTDDEGRYLPDFSFAGYQNGMGLSAAPAEAVVVDVTEPPFAADPTGVDDSTVAIQAAIDAAAAEVGGAVVFLPEGLYRVDGALRVTSSHTVLRGEGPAASRLWFTASAGRAYRSHVTFAGTLQTDLDITLAEDTPARALTILVTDAGALAPGDDITLGHVISDEFVAEHGMTGTWRAFNGTWQPFLWRTVVAVDRETDPHRVTLDVPVRYPLLVRDAASLRRVQGTLTEVGFEGLGIADAVLWDQAWAENQVHVVELDGVRDAWIRDVASFRSPGAPDEGPGSVGHLQSGGVIVRRAKRVTVADVHLADAQNRGGGGNGYLFEVRQSSEVLFRDCTARAGRHNFIQNWGFGATGIVWLRIRSDEGRVFSSSTATASTVGYSEFHHSLATANLIDASWFGDGWSAINRGDWSTGAGHTATKNVIWNTSGPGSVISMQYGWGYVIGTAPETGVFTQILLPNSAGTEPEDWTEGLGRGALLEPQSLYEDQLARRRAREE